MTGPGGTAPNRGAVPGNGGDAFAFSPADRARALERMASEQFDLLVIGGGITGAAVARDAASRGLRVAVVERKDFAYGTSSRSSKLVHGGLRYLEKMEFSLVFEALAERALLLRTAPTMVRPLPFFFPVYQGDPVGRAKLGLGMWLYDLLALFRTPGFHRQLSRDAMLREIPALRAEGLRGGFRYFDASMWDDVLAVETLRAAHFAGAAVASYVEVTGGEWSGDRMTGARATDRETGQAFAIRAHRTVVCAGPWTDEIGKTLFPDWKPWLNPSKGVHLVFDGKRLPLPGALVMNHPEDGRISFVIPRPDYGPGVTIVGTTDGPTPVDPAQATVEDADVRYLMELLHRYFPSLNLTDSDILSAYVGVRPLFGSGAGGPGGAPDGASADAQSLQKVSREHHLAEVAGGAVVVAGGKYTTHRRMGEEIVDFTLKCWRREGMLGRGGMPPASVGPSRTRLPVNPKTLRPQVEEARAEALRRHLDVPELLYARYGRDALDVAELDSLNVHSKAAAALRELGDPPGFPKLAGQLRYAIRREMALHLEDFYLRRVPLHMARADHGLPWAPALAQVWAEERGLGAAEAQAELEGLRAEIAKRSGPPFS